jgi:hypothetical protein
MKIVLALILLFVMAGVSLAADVKLNGPLPIEINDPLPAPYQCLSYHGHSADNIAIMIGVGEKCLNKVVGYGYPKIYGTEAVFTWKGENLVFKLVGTGGKSQVDLYRRVL